MYFYTFHKKRLAAIIISIILIALIVVVFLVSKPFTVTPPRNSTTTITHYPTTITSTIPFNYTPKTRFLGYIQRFDSINNIIINYKVNGVFSPVLPQSYLSGKSPYTPPVISLPYYTYYNTLPYYITIYKLGNIMKIVQHKPQSFPANLESNSTYYVIDNKTIICNVPSNAGIPESCSIAKQVPAIQNFPIINNMAFILNPNAKVKYNGQATVNKRACNNFVITAPYNLTIGNIIENSTANITECIDAQFDFPSSISTKISYFRGPPTQLLSANLTNGSIGVVNASDVALPTSFGLGAYTNGNEINCTAHTLSFNFIPFQNLSNPTLKLTVIGLNSTTPTPITVAAFNKVLNGEYTAFNSYYETFSFTQDIINDSVSIQINNNSETTSCAPSFVTAPKLPTTSTTTTIPPTSSIIPVSSNIITASSSSNVITVPPS